MKPALILLLLTTFALPASAAAPWEGARVAFLGLTFLDTSTEGAYNGARTDETARLQLLEDDIREEFIAHGADLVDLAPIEDELQNTVNPANCYGCEIRMARKVDADYVLVGVVQKVSNLILSMNLVMRDVETEAVVAGRAVEIRSNTDDSWLRGMRYLLKTTFFKP